MPPLQVPGPIMLLVQVTPPLPTHLKRHMLVGKGALGDEHMVLTEHHLQQKQQQQV
jgi:hypothetical protein